MNNDAHAVSTLIVLGSPSPGARYELSKRRTTVIGRDVNCDIILRHPAVSRHHALIVGEDGQFFLEDTGSQNGTFVNGSRVATRICLQDGDRIDLADVPLIFFRAAEFDTDEESTVTFPPRTTQDQQPAANVESGTDVLLPLVLNVAGVDQLQGRLDLLLQITRQLGSSLAVTDILPRVLELLFQMYPQANEGQIDLVDTDGRLTVVAEKRGREREPTVRSGALIEAGMVREAIDGRRSILRSSDSSGKDARNEAGNSTMCVPVIAPPELDLGAILLHTSDACHGFNSEDVELVSTVAILTGQALSYARAHEIVLRHTSAQRHLDAARSIQLGMLPRQSPTVPGYVFCNHYVAADRVGGDYFFYERLSNRRVIFGVADASGKGLPAAIKISRLAGEVRFRISTSRTLKSALKRLNQFVLEFADAGFITLCVGVLDPRSHTLTVASAGHMPPLRRSGASCEVEELPIPNGSLPLGIEPQPEFHPVRYGLEPGDEVLIYTDGVTEAMNSQRELYRKTRLIEAISRSEVGIEAVLATIVRDLESFRAGAAPSDDTCMVGLQRLSA